MRYLVKIVCCFFIFSLTTAGVSAQAIRDEMGGADVADLPPVKIAIFSSGLAYFEHSGNVSGPVVVNLPFKPNAVNDALMSLVLTDPASTNPFVSYQSEQTLFQTLRSLKIDLSDNPGLSNMLDRLRGAEVEITAPSPVSGRIVGVETQSVFRSGNPMLGETFDHRLSLLTDKGLQRFNLNEINSLNFKDPAINADFQRALDLILQSRNSNTRDLSVHLPGRGSRKVVLSYVIPAPVWKVSYRLDLGNDPSKALFQGWAVVDNDGDSDWKNVQLSLVSGRPASFIQNLYPPYYVARPVLPLSIAGVASGESHDAGYTSLKFAAEAEMASAASVPPMPPMRAPVPMTALETNRDMDERARASSVTGGVLETAAGAAAGDQFEFTVKNPVNLDRRMSAMLPLTEAVITARKLLVFSGGSSGVNRHPRLGAELTNTSSMKIPAGPITVYDGGTYAGDALIEFWNENEKRIISYGEDLSVTGTVADSGARTMVSVTVSGGVMTLNRSQDFTKTYTFKNNGAQTKALVVEHPKTVNTTLETPTANEETPTHYRFNVTLAASGETSLRVREVRPLTERITLLQTNQNTFLSYTTNQEIPERVRTALQRAVTLRTAVSAAETEVTRAEGRRTSLLAEQDRIRKNIEAAGNQSTQGQEYLRRLQSLDNDIDNMAPELERLRAAVVNAQKAYEDYLNGLNL
jgi:hypothetical protein